MASNSKEDERPTRSTTSSSSIMPPLPPGSALLARDVLSQSLELHRQSQEREANRQQKTDELLRCLAGTNSGVGGSSGAGEREETVDLWHLRELALSKGGLLSPTLRRRAWPKLLGVDSHVLGGGGDGPDRQQQQEVRLPSSAVSELRRDVGRTAWDVEGHIRRSRSERDAERKNNRRGAPQKKQRGAGVANLGFPAPAASKNGGADGIRSGSSTPGTCTGGVTPQLVPECTRAFPRAAPPVRCVNFEPPGTVVGTISPAMSPAVPYFPSSGSGRGGGGTQYYPSSSASATTSSGTASGTLSPPSIPEYHGSSSPVVAYHTFDAPSATNGGVANGFAPDAAALAAEEANEPPTIATVTKKVRLPPEAQAVPRRTKAEQDLLLNILTTVLRAPPKGYDETDSRATRLHYTVGLHDLASLILINLESPSLTALTLRQLSSHHLRDTMRPTLNELTATVRTAFLPLLSNVDPTVHDHLVTGGITSDCPFATGWVVSWFAHEITDFDVASRLVDFFLASHALMPVYLSVALLSHPANRQRILCTEADCDSLGMILARMPRDMVEEKIGEVADLCSSGGGGSSDAHVDEAGNKAGLMDLFEEVIEAAITHMREIPPPILIRKARKYQNGSLSSYAKMARSATMLQRPPRWASAPTAPTDWALIQRAKAAREASRRLLLLGGSPSSPQVRGRCWSSSSTPTSSPGEASSKKKFFASSSPPELSVSKFFAASSSAPTTASTATIHRIALDASGLGATVDTADTPLGKVWKTVACLFAVTAAASYGLNGYAGNVDPVRISAAKCVPLPNNGVIVQGAAKKFVEGQKTRSACTRKSNSTKVSSALTMTPSNNETKHSFMLDISSVVTLISPSKVQPENAFVYGASDEASDMPAYALRVAFSEDDLVDLDTPDAGEVLARTSAPKSTSDVETPKASRLNRLSDIMNGALPSYYYY